MAIVQRVHLQYSLEIRKIYPETKSRQSDAIKIFREAVSRNISKTKNISSCVIRWFGDVCFNITYLNYSPGNSHVIGKRWALAYWCLVYIFIASTSHLRLRFLYNFLNLKEVSCCIQEHAYIWQSFSEYNRILIKLCLLNILWLYCKLFSN